MHHLSCQYGAARPQFFNVVLDTGSADLWIADSSCVRGCSSNTPFYNADQSSSYTASSNASQQVRITYGSGEIAGVVGSETVSMGGFQVQNQPFGEQSPLIPHVHA